MQILSDGSTKYYKLENILLSSPSCIKRDPWITLFMLGKVYLSSNVKRVKNSGETCLLDLNIFFQRLLWWMFLTRRTLAEWTFQVILWSLVCWDLQDNFGFVILEFMITSCSTSLTLPSLQGLPDSERAGKKGKKKGGAAAKKTLSLQNFLQDENQVQHVHLDIFYTCKMLHPLQLLHFPSHP